MNFGGLTWPGDPATPGPVSILLHGFLDHAGAWEGVSNGLTGERVALDHRGHGRSEHNPPGATYVFADYLADLDALVDVVSPDAPVRLVGHSMGGTIATLYAGARPGRVRSVVSLDGLGLADGVTGAAVVDSDPVSDRMIKFLDAARKPPRNRAMPSVAFAAERLASSYARTGIEWATRMAERATIQAPDGPEGWVTWSFDPMHRARSPLPYRHAHHLPLLRRIACPVLALHPGTSSFSAEDVDLLEAAIPRLERAVVPGTSHVMHLEEPAAIAAHIVAFWSRIEGYSAH